MVTPLKTLMGFSVHLNVQLKFYNLPITKGQADTLNKTAVLKQGPNWWLYIGIGLLLLLLIILVIWYIWRKQRKIKSLEKQLAEKDK
ncbi:hypothetical protein [Lactiplantibacillus plantarum]|uniref:hypothetical protein n=1 Tax=Lactiplantibacillus plantarum TaxID=1590 RepID=UPI001E4BE643|nr:hypothetical protein [Lactiplantibacillus plantarum]